MIIHLKFKTQKFKLNTYKTLRVPDSENFSIKDFIQQWLENENNRRVKLNITKLDLVGANKQADPHHFIDYNTFMKCERCALRFDFNIKQREFHPDRESEKFVRIGCLK